MEATLAGGGTIAHHHGIGRMRVPWLERELGDAYPVLRALKRALDPAGIMNPGALLAISESRHQRAARAGIVRPARRPADWRAPGPPPAPAPDVPGLWPGPARDLCHLAGDWRDPPARARPPLVAGRSRHRLVRRRHDVRRAAGADRRSGMRHRRRAGPARVALPRRACDRRRGAGGERAAGSPVARLERVEGACEVRHGDLRGTASFPRAHGRSRHRHAALPAGRQRSRVGARAVGGVPPRAARRGRGVLRGGRTRAGVGRLVRDLRRRGAGGACSRWRRARRLDRRPAARGGPARRQASAVRRLGHATRGSAGRRRGPLVVRDRAGGWTAAFRAVRGAMGMPA